MARPDTITLKQLYQQTHLNVREIARRLHEAEPHGHFCVDVRTRAILWNAAFATPDGKPTPGTPTPLGHLDNEFSGLIRIDEPYLNRLFVSGSVCLRYFAAMHVENSSLLENELHFNGLFVDAKGDAMGKVENDSPSGLWQHRGCEFFPESICVLRAWARKVFDLPIESRPSAIASAPVTIEVGEPRHERLLKLLAAAVELIAKFEAADCKRRKITPEYSTNDGKPIMAQLALPLATRCGSGFSDGSIAKDLGAGWKLLNPKK